LACAFRQVFLELRAKVSKDWRENPYAVAVFRKFGVNSRAALMSLWLGAT